MSKSNKENLPYQQKLVMVVTILITLFLVTGFSAGLSFAATRAIATNETGPLGESLKSQAGTLTINLLGVTSYELAEIFNDIIETTPGITEARRCQLHLDPNHPQAGKVEWQIKFNKTTPFAIESAIYKRLKELSDNNVTTYLTNGFAINLSDGEFATLKEIKPGQSTSHTLCFIEMNVFAKNTPTKWYNNHPRTINNWINYPNRGFE